MDAYLGGDSVFETSGPTSIELFLPRVPGHSDDFCAIQVASFFMFTYPADCGKTVAHGHLDVHQAIKR